MIIVMHDLIVGVFEHPEITSIFDIDLRIIYMKRILRRSILKIFLQVLLDCKELAKGLSVYQWSLVSEKIEFWTRDKVEATDRTGNSISGSEHCAYFEK